MICESFKNVERSLFIMYQTKKKVKKKKKKKECDGAAMRHLMWCMLSVNAII